jgi:tetratricopeptide (TPR) repeat protein
MAVEEGAAVTGAPIYAARFLDSIVRSIEGVRARLDLADQTLPSIEDRELALHILDFALKVEAAWPSARDVLSILAPRMEQAGHRDDWSPFLERGIEESLVREDRATEAQLRFYLGMIHELRARFEQADAEFAASALCYAQMVDPVKQANALSRRAYIARLQRRYDDAEPLLQQALSLLPADAPERATCYFTQGVIAFDRLQWREAADALNRSLLLWEALNNKHMIALSLRNLGPALHWLGEYDAAIRSYKRALALFEESPDPVHQAVTRMNLGIVYSLQDKGEAALALYQQAEPVFRRLQDELNMARVYTNLGIEYRTLGQLEAAEASNRQAIALWQKLHNLRSELNVMDELGLTYLAQGLTGQAIATFKEALKRLETIAGTPGADRLLSLLSQHLAQARHNSETFF